MRGRAQPARASFGADAHARARAATTTACWTGRTGGLRAALDRRRRARAGGGTGRTHGLELVLDEGEHHDLVLVLAPTSPPTSRPTPTAAWRATEAAWRERVPDARPHVAARATPATPTPCCAGLTSAGGGDGRGRDDVAARTRPSGPQLRLPLRLDPRPVLRGPGGRRGTGRTRCWTTPSRSCATGSSTTGPACSPRTRRRAARCPTSAQLDLPGYPGGADDRRQPGQRAVPARRLRRGAAAVRRRGPPRPARRRRLARRRGRGRADRGALAPSPTPGSGSSTTGRWTHSRLICAAGLRAISRAARAPRRAARLARAGRRDRRRTARDCLHPSGRWQRSPDDRRLDAALLLPGDPRRCPADDPRTIATLARVRARADRGRVRVPLPPRRAPARRGRGRVPALRLPRRRSPLGQQGEAVEAARWFERNRAACGPPGLLAEEFDVTQRQLRGNLPQAFVHALLLHCAAEQQDL